MKSNKSKPIRNNKSKPRRNNKSKPRRNKKSNRRLVYQLGGGDEDIQIEKATITIEELVEGEFEELYANGEEKNSGQNNDGIIFIGKYAIKAGTNVHDMVYAKGVNTDLKGLFPMFYLWSDGNLYHEFTLNGLPLSCIIMDRFEGDLTKYILETAYKRQFGELDTDYNYMLGGFPNTMLGQYVLSTESKFTDLLEQISPHINDLLRSLEPSVIKLHHEMIKKGWNHNDNKFDNVAYISDPTNDLGIKLFLIDSEALRKIPVAEVVDDWHEYLGISDRLSSYGIFGQYSLPGIGFVIESDNSGMDFNEKESIVSYMTGVGWRSVVGDRQPRHHQFVKFQKSDKFFIVIQKVLNKFRLIRFDVIDRIPQYDHWRDELFDSLDGPSGLYSQLGQYEH